MYPQAFLKDKYVITFNAHAGQGGSVQHNLHQLLLHKEAKPVSHISIKYCSNHIGFTYPKNEFEVQGVVRSQFLQVPAKCALFCNFLLNKIEYTFPKQSCAPRFGSFITSPIFKKISTMRPVKYTVNENCIGCSTCVYTCPVAVIELIDGKAVFTVALVVFSIAHLGQSATQRGSSLTNLNITLTNINCAIRVSSF
ncbi:4Fe-4S_ferredoxin iron-sulfur binding domain protein [Hexamita inflata]|uniref:4Fe-4S_ferredoxin iron-sulfur binding domain protein n=1 Tax=Hexamita inflata TaxID=28002 RepID=A0ABP1KJ92_9EUKA